MVLTIKADCGVAVTTTVDVEVELSCTIGVIVGVDLEVVVARGMEPGVVLTAAALFCEREQARAREDARCRRAGLRSTSCIGSWPAQRAAIVSETSLMATHLVRRVGVAVLARRRPRLELAVLVVEADGHLIVALAVGVRALDRSIRQRHVHR